jgi:threonine dehydrogenase-like Zn-dependent dehydrogenase
MGHEFVGIVEAVGADVTDIEPDQVVTSDLNHRCGECDQCRAGRSHLCRSGQDGIFSNRAFASRADLLHSYLLPIDAPVKPHLALSEPLSCALHAVEWTEPTDCDRVLVVGAGGIGMCVTFALTRLWPVVSVDLVDLRRSRLNALHRAIGREPGLRHAEYDVVIDTSGTEAGLRTACEKVTKGGRLCTMSHLPGSEPGGFLLRALTRRDISFKVSYLNGDRANLKTAVRLLVEGWDEGWDALIELAPVEDLPGAFARRPASDAPKTIIDLGPTGR